MSVVHPSTIQQSIQHLLPSGKLNRIEFQTSPPPDHLSEAIVHRLNERRIRSSTQDYGRMQPHSRGRAHLGSTTNSGRRSLSYPHCQLHFSASQRSHIQSLDIWRCMLRLVVSAIASPSRRMRRLPVCRFSPFTQC